MRRWAWLIPAVGCVACKPVPQGLDPADLAPLDAAIAIDQASRDVAAIDRAQTPDLAMPDLATPDSTVVDLLPTAVDGALPPDFGLAADLMPPPVDSAMPPDLIDPADLTPAVDGTVPPDLVIPDLSAPPDFLQAPPDLTRRPADMTVTRPDLFGTPSCLTSGTLNIPFTYDTCSYPGTDINNCAAKSCTHTVGVAKCDISISSSGYWVSHCELGADLSGDSAIYFTSTTFESSWHCFSCRPVSGPGNVYLDVDCRTGVVRLTEYAQDGWADPCGLNINYVSQLNGTCTLGVDC